MQACCTARQMQSVQHHTLQTELKILALLQPSSSIVLGAPPLTSIVVHPKMWRSPQG